MPVDSSGAIPAEAQSLIQGKEGTYWGSLRIHSDRSGEGELVSQNFAASISLDGLRPTLQFSQDLLGPGCFSRPGRLLSLQTHLLGWEALAVFEFDRGSCASRANDRTLAVYLKGNELMISLDKKSFNNGSQPHLDYETEYRANLKR